MRRQVAQGGAVGKNGHECALRTFVFVTGQEGSTMQMKRMDTVPTPPGAEDGARDACRGLAQIIDRIGDKWTVMVVGHLSDGTMRFNQLMRAIPGISHRMLTLTLRALERDGLVARTAYPTVPPRVDYELTDLGRSLTEPLLQFADWASAHRGRIEAAQRSYDVRDPKSVGSLDRSHGDTARP